MRPVSGAFTQIPTADARPPEWAGWLGLAMLLAILGLLTWWLLASPIRGAVQPVAPDDARAAHALPPGVCGTPQLRALADWRKLGRAVAPSLWRPLRPGPPVATALAAVRIVPTERCDGRHWAFCGTARPGKCANPVPTGAAACSARIARGGSGSHLSPLTWCGTRSSDPI